MSDAENSDDERYANESFENETDNEIPEMTEIESETSGTGSDEDDDDALSSVKMNTGPLRRNSFPNNLSTPQNTDTIPFASSSDEEDDVVIGETLAEINTPSMHFNISPPHSDTIFQENSHRLKTLEERQINYQELTDEDDDDEEEFKKIQDLEERYIQQSSAKLTNSTVNQNCNGNEQTYLTDEEEERDSEEQETEDEQESETETETEEVINDNQNKLQNHKVHPLENKESIEENIEEELNKPETDHSGEDLDNNSNRKSSFDQANLMEMIQKSLANLTTSSLTTNENDIPKKSQPTTVMDDSATALLPFQNDSNTAFNPQKIAMAVVNALKSTGLTNKTSLNNLENVQKLENTDIREIDQEKGQSNHKINVPDQTENDVNGVEAETDEVGDKDDIEEIHNDQDYELDYDDDRDVYYNSHFDYRITSKTPSSFNSDEYIFHANFIKPFHRTQSIDKLRSKPHKRKSMSFSNERMREIERHNQILLRKILTQKPTYTAKSKSVQPATVQKVTSQTNLRVTTSAVNRKKQQRQIELDNQVLRRKIEAISLRRRPLIS